MRVLLLRTASDRPLLTILASIRERFAGVEVTLLTAADQPRSHLPVDRFLLHWGGRIALIRLVRQEGYQLLAVPWTGEPIQPRWKLLLPFFCRRHHIVIFNEAGHFFPLSRRGLGRLVDHAQGRWRRPRVAPPSVARLAWGGLAVGRLLVRLPWLWLGAAFRGATISHPGER